MAKAEKTAVVPRLRFSEFQSAPEWKEKKLSAEVFLVSGLHLAPNQYGTSGEVPYFTGPSDFTNSLQNVTKWTKASTSTAKQHDTLITVKGSGVGEIWYLEMPLVAIGRQLMAVRTNGCSSRFIFQLLLLKRSRFEDLAAGNLIPGLARGDILDLIAPIPEEDEQQKIADCLSSLDELIAAQGRKVEALKTYKRGLVQQLFPREGETRPRLRFPEFAKTGAWHTQKVASLLSKASFAVSVDPEETYREIGIRSHGKGIFHKEPVFGKVIGDKRVFKVVQDALVLNIVFAWEQAVATTSEKEVGMIASHRFPMYVAKPNMCDVEYVKGFFLTKEGKRLLGVASPGGAGRNKTLGQKDFDNLEIALPVSVNEQTRIANCLSSCDATITIESDKLESLKAHKKGLMQQLFPSQEVA